MAQYLISEAAALLGVSSDTVRRWVSAGRLPATANEQGRQVVPGSQLAELSASLAPGEENSAAPSSARNRARGLVTDIKKDTVMAQVSLQCGPFRFVSLMSREAVDELNLTVGDAAEAVVKATNVIVELRR